MKQIQSLRYRGICLIFLDLVISTEYEFLGPQEKQPVVWSTDAKIVLRHKKLCECRCAFPNLFPENFPNSGQLSVQNFSGTSYYHPYVKVKISNMLEF
ncbi:hypothetical protein AMTRI_Chr05g74060 [Amborella trichopoda]